MYGAEQHMLNGSMSLGAGGSSCGRPHESPLIGSIAVLSGCLVSAIGKSTFDLKLNISVEHS